jgi:iron(III) transport system substrate-binding protein
LRQSVRRITHRKCSHRPFHAQIKEKRGHRPLPALKLLNSNPAAVLAQSEEIKARYAKLFKV